MNGNTGRLSATLVLSLLSIVSAARAWIFPPVAYADPEFEYYGCWVGWQCDQWPGCDTTLGEYCIIQYCENDPEPALCRYYALYYCAYGPTGYCS